jgi:hypothetical protein
MRASLRDVASLLMGGLEIDDDVTARWLRKGRARLDKLTAPLLAETRESFHASADPVPVGIRTATYRVEARREILRAANEVVIYTLLIAAAVGVAVAVTRNTWWWCLVIGSGGLAVAALVQRRGSKLAAQSAPLEDSLDTIAWAYYYPIQRSHRLEGTRSANGKAKRYVDTREACAT